MEGFMIQKADNGGRQALGPVLFLEGKGLLTCSHGFQALALAPMPEEGEGTALSCSNS
jgi:hypothetical protein